MSKSNTTLNLYSIEIPEWSQVNNRHKDKMAEIITGGGWHSLGDLRRGFLNCTREQDILYGYFAQEGRIHIEQYDDEQQPFSEEEKSFERILFILFLDAGILAIQSVRIPRYIDLTGSDLRESLFNLLDVTFRQADLIYQKNASFTRYKVEFSREELIQIFESHEIQRIKVKDLLNSRIPPDFRFFNPDFDKDAFLKAIIDEDLENTDEAEWVGNNIQETKLARGLIHAGNPALVEGLDDTGYIREWTPSTPQSFSIDIDTDDVHLPEEDLRKVLDFIVRTFGIFSERLKQFDRTRDHGDLPLFNKPSE